MDSLGSITQCIRDLEAGVRRNEAAQALWDRYFGGLARYAMTRLQAMHVARAVADEQDAALWAFDKVCRGIERGQLKLGGRDDFLKLLRWSTRGEAIKQGKVRGADDAGIDQVPGKELPPELFLMAEEGCRRLLDLLNEEELRRIALLKLIGHTDKEIARKLGCTQATVERKLKRIRLKWAHVAPAGPPMPGPRNTSGVEVAEDIGGLTVILRQLAGQVNRAG
jgi:DNA-directed RNA polymerase specialized sigma24 family protein